MKDILLNEWTGAIKKTKPDRLIRKNLMLQESLFLKLKEIAKNSNKTISKVTREILIKNIN